MIFLQTLLGIIAFIFILGLIVLVHEGGHFIFARRAGILCYEFSIGMGPVIWQKKKGETVYSLRAIPIGGFVSMAGEEVESNPLQGIKEVKLVTKENRVTHIITDLTHHDYQALPTLKLVEYDLIGTKDALDDELFIITQLDEEDEVELIVNRDAIMVMGKKSMMQIAPYNRNFTNKSLGKRFLSVVSGPLMNFILAVLIFFIIGLFVGHANLDSTIIDQVSVGSPAQTVLLQKGDQLTSINGEKVLLWQDISDALAKLASGEDFTGKITITYQRDGSDYAADVNPIVLLNMVEIYLVVDGSNDPIVGAYPENNEKSASYKAGIRENDIITKIEHKGNIVEIKSRADLLKYFDQTAPEGGEYKITVLRDGKEEVFVVAGYSKEVLESQNYAANKVQIGISPGYSFNLAKSLYMPFVNTGDSALLIFRTLKMLFTDSTIGIGDLSGPVGILTATTSIAKNGIIPLLNWAAILSVNIGFLNILPLPALDGGRLAFLGYEAITRKKPNAKVENIIHLVGLLFFMALFVFVTFSDIMRCTGLK